MASPKQTKPTRKGKVQKMLFSTIKKMANYCKEYQQQTRQIVNRSRSYLLPPSAAYVEKYADILENATHLLIGGTTGSGKSVILNGLLHTALALYGPGDMSFILIDPKIVELSAYKRLPHTLRYETEPEEVLALLRQIYGFMMDRYAEMDKTGAKKYNGTKVVIVIDELADLLMSAYGKAIKAELVKILQKGRAANIMVIMATQSPSRKVLSAELVLNVPNRIALYCDNAIESKQVIGCKGAENLPWHGSCLYKYPGKGEPERLDGVPLFTDEEITERIRWWTKQAA